MLEIILARHAETIFNEQLRYIGSTDLSLSELGRRNAALAADYLAGRRIDRIYASGMKRALETAAVIAEPRGLKVTAEPLFNEIDFGDWEGLTHAQIEERYPEIIDDWIKDPVCTSIPGGESWTDFAERVLRAWRRMILENDPTENRTILAVVHAGPIKVVLGRILGLPPADWWRIYQDKGAFNYLCVEKNCVHLIRANDTDFRRLAAGGEPEQIIKRCDFGDMEMVRRLFGCNPEYLVLPSVPDAAEWPAEQLLRRGTCFKIDFNGLTTALAGYHQLDEHKALMDVFVVLPACRGGEWEHRLQERLEESARENGCSLLIAMVSKKAEVLTFFLNRGFKALSTEWMKSIDSKSTIIQKQLT